MEKSSPRVIRHKRSEYKDESTIIDNVGPIHIQPSWKPIQRNKKPPYSYATIIAHAILCSNERKLTLNEIYHWITINYPFYSNESQGWQNSIRHNLSLHKSFVKVERDPNPPRKGCFWTIRKGKETKFIDNLQKPIYNNKRTNYKHTDEDEEENDDNNNQDSTQNQLDLIPTTTPEQPSSVYYDAYRIYSENDLESTSCDTFSTHSEDHHHYSLFNSPPPTANTTKSDWTLNYFS
ncbi:hypothetical protein K501DRAFT_331624 [Backusella circina FSU 941]|nr:hypothetical protein K501DRAFT_331624 [Backusella circina FSU 941]